MIRERSFYFLTLLMFFFASCGNEVRDGMIVFTRSSGELFQIVAVDSRNPKNTLEILTGTFFSAKEPDVSSDGQWLVFSAIEKEHEAWQIWKMRLDDMKLTKVTSSLFSCSDPAWLPGNQIVFSSENGIQPGKSLFTCNADGSEVTRITFDPYEYASAMVLRDGRVLASRRYREQLAMDEMIAVLRPDGTKAGTFYKSPPGITLEYLGKEDTDGKIYLIESAEGNITGGDIVSINYNMPLNSRKNLTSSADGTFRSVYTSSGKMYVSCRLPGKNKFSIHEYDKEQGIVGAVFENSEWDAFDPVVVLETARPKKLPSEVDPGVKTGLLLCQDVNFNGIRPQFTGFVPAEADKIKIIGADSSLGITKVEEDGSFYLKIISDTPFRILTLDKQGRILNGPSAWMYLRPNERRGCVGCHEDPQTVPENKVPAAVRKAPVSIPLQTSDIKEKEIQLE